MTPSTTAVRPALEPCPAQFAGANHGRATHPPDSLAEERRELFESVIQARESPECDADRLAACDYLLRHLALTSRQ